MLEQLLHLDRELFLYLNNLGSVTWDGFWMFLTNKWSSIPLYFLLLILAYRVLGVKKTILLLVAVALLITTTDQLANFFKSGVQRLRPCYDPDLSGQMRLVKGYCGGKFGFFSAHAANSAALALFFGLVFKEQYRWLGIFLAIWVLLLAYSRIYVGVHFPLDVLSGIAIGMGLSWIFVKLFNLAQQKFRL